MISITIPASAFDPAKTTKHMLHHNSTTTIGNSKICDIEVKRRCIDDVHLIIRYNTADNSVFVRDNKTESGTYRIDRDEALNHNTF